MHRCNVIQLTWLPGRWVIVMSLHVVVVVVLAVVVAGLI